MINRARGATLLIDEAYQLSPPDMTKDFGLEAVETIMGVIEGGPATEDDRPVIIFAGYPAEMKRFVAVNAGLERRITQSFFFKDYNHAELASIFMKMLGSGGYKFEGDMEALETLFNRFFTIDITAKYNAGLCSHLFSDCRTIINARAVQQLMNPKPDDLTDSLAVQQRLRNTLTTCTLRDVEDSCLAFSQQST